VPARWHRRTEVNHANQVGNPTGSRLAVVRRKHGRFQMIAFAFGFVLGALACPALITWNNWRARRDQA